MHACITSDPDHAPCVKISYVGTYNRLQCGPDQVGYNLQSIKKGSSSSFSSTIMPIRPSLSLFNVYKRTFSLWHIILIEKGVDLVWSVSSAPQHITQHFVPTPKKSCRVSIPQLTDKFFVKECWAPGHPINAGDVVLLLSTDFEC
jgi:hypothetical protein